MKTLKIVGTMKTFLAMTVLGVGAAHAAAATTPVSSPPSGEASHLQILEAVYGGSFTASGLDFVSDGGVTATRVDDAADEISALEAFSARAVAKFGSFQQAFGYSQNGSFNQLFNITGSGFAVSGDGFAAPGGEPITFGVNGTKGLFSSVATENPFDADQLVTYEITGLNGASTWLLFWEDQTLDKSDRDFNDAVVEVSAASVIPLPPAALTGIATLLGTGAMGVIRRRRQSR